MTAWPQIIWCVLVIISLAVHATRHGERKVDTYSLPVTLFSAILLGALLYWGGFFNVWL